jgi:hypothetical protein
VTRNLIFRVHRAPFSVRKADRAVMHIAPREKKSIAASSQPILLKLARNHSLYFFIVFVDVFFVTFDRSSC